VLAIHESNLMFVLSKEYGAYIFNMTEAFNDDSLSGSLLAEIDLWSYIPF